MRKILTLLMFILLGTACHEGNVKPGCPLVACTDIFASIGVTFVDSAGQPIAIQNFQAIDLRTNLRIIPEVQTALLIRGFYIIADDSDLKDLSTDGDDIQVSATNPLTHQTKTVIFKIAGGCNCHVTKLSGPDQIKFD
jgi:hypothetical protein